MNKFRSQLIVALDVDSFEKAKTLIDALSEGVDIFKVGSQLFTACGPEIVRYILGREKNVFLDLKYHDIPHTVGNAVSVAVGITERNRGIFMCSVHIAGGKDMLVKAVAAATKKSQNIGVTKPLLVGITILTSEETRDNIRDIVLERAKLAKESGLNGVVASSQEAARIRQECGKDFIIVTPGIRLPGSALDDQKRVSTPAEAILNGSDFLVVGRPIIKAENPLKTAKKILEEIKQIQS
jgi:orotidine-5'-phosphate decarboxylase